MKKILNVLLGLLLAVTALMCAWAFFTSGSDAAISANLVWAYALAGVGIAAALFCAVHGLLQNPSGLKGALVALVLIVVVLGVSYMIASGHDVQIPDLQNKTFFPRVDTVITETSCLVAYVAAAAAIVTAVVTEIWGALK